MHQLGFPRIPNMRAYRRYPSAKYASVSAKKKLNMRAYMRILCAHICAKYARIYAQSMRAKYARIYAQSMRKVCAKVCAKYARIYAQSMRILCAYIRTHTLRIYTHAYYARMCAYVNMGAIYPRISTHTKPNYALNKKR